MLPLAPAPALVLVLGLAQRPVQQQQAVEHLIQPHWQQQLTTFAVGMLSSPRVLTRQHCHLILRTQYQMQRLSRTWGTLSSCHNTPQACTLSHTPSPPPHPHSYTAAAWKRGNRAFKPVLLMSAQASKALFAMTVDRLKHPDVHPSTWDMQRLKIAPSDPPELWIPIANRVSVAGGCCCYFQCLLSPWLIVEDWFLALPSSTLFSLFPL